MEYYEREKIIAECRKKLPYPISFYDKLSDGSLWNVYNKHVLQGIPINKRSQKAKAENDVARAQEALDKIEKEQKRESQEVDQEQAWEEYQQMTLDEYMASLQPAKPKLVRSANGSWWRLTDSGDYDWVPDSELDDVLGAFGVNVASEPIKEEGPVKKLTRNPGRR